MLSFDFDVSVTYLFFDFLLENNPIFFTSLCKFALNFMK
jgi:hypothetical protein